MRISQTAIDESGFKKSKPATALIREHIQRFGLGCPSLTGEYHTHCIDALINSLNNNSSRHAKITQALMLDQIAYLNMQTTEDQVATYKTSLSMHKHMD